MFELILLFILRLIVILVWSFSAFVFWIFVRLRVMTWLVVLPKFFARVAIFIAAYRETMLIVCILLGGSSLLLWDLLPIQLSLILAILIPILFTFGTIKFGHADKLNIETFVIDAAKQGNVTKTREQILIYVSYGQMINKMKALIRIGTDINAPDPLNRCPLYCAVMSSEMVELLLQAGAKPDGRTLVEAARQGRLDIIKLLFAATPDDGKALVAEVGDRALDYAIHIRYSGEQDRNQVVQMLLERGAKPISSENRDSLI